MPLFKINDCKLLFIHIPKTGGTSLEHWLSDQGEISYYSTVVPSFLKCSPQHFTMSYLKLLDPHLDCPAFTIVRDPYDRAESEYFFRVKGQSPNLRPNFSAWMIRHLELAGRNPHHLDNHWLPQSYFVETDVTVYRYEEGIDTIIGRIHKEHGIPLPKEVPHHHQSERTPLKWSTELLIKFNTFYAADFEVLQYPLRTVKSV